MSIDNKQSFIVGNNNKMYQKIMIENKDHLVCDLHQRGFSQNHSVDPVSNEGSNFIFIQPTQQCTTEVSNMTLKTDPTQMANYTNIVVDKHTKHKTEEGCAIKQEYVGDPQETKSDSDVEFYTSNNANSDQKPGMQQSGIECSICTTMYANVSDYTHHLKVHSGQIAENVQHVSKWKPLKCSLCDLVCTTSAGLKSHQAGVHGIYLEKTWPSAKRLDECAILYKCNECGKVLRNKTGFKRHKYEQHELPRQISRVHVKSKKPDGVDTNTKGKTNDRIVKSDKYDMIARSHDSQPDTNSMREKSKCDDSMQSNALTENAEAKVNNTSKDETLSCSFCSRTFLTKKALGSHMQAHSEGKSYQCDVCLKMYKFEISLEHHKQKRHSKVYPSQTKPRAINTKTNSFPCSICGLIFQRKLTMKLHKRTHEGVITYKCDLCDKFFFKEGTFNAHKTSHARGKPFKCSQCSKSFAFEAVMKAHVKIIHSTETKDSVNFTCDICEEDFPHKVMLFTHYASKHIERVKKQYKCSICSKLCRSQSYLEIHMRSHTGERPFTCSFCPTSFVSITHLKRHIKLHTENRKNYKCIVCGQQFNTMIEHSMHKKTHPKTNAFSCSVCGKKFNRKSTLQSHEYSHLKVKPYACDLCEMTFSSCSGMKTHRRTHTRKRDFTCDKCGKIISSENLFKQHMYLHTGKMEFSCSFCKQMFPTISEMKRHKYDAHPEQYVKCHFCSALFTCELKMKTHLKVHGGKYRCGGCQLCFVSESALQKHLIDHCEMRINTTMQKCMKQRSSNLKCHNGYGTTIKSNTPLGDRSKSTNTGGYRKRGLRCLMCCNWFSHTELPKHFWFCKVKRPCLNRIDFQGKDEKK